MVFPNRFLIVDQENPLRRDLIDVLTTECLDQDIAVFTSESGADALKIADEEAIDFIIVARLSTQEETVDLVQQLRAHEKVGDVPILMTSSFYVSPDLDLLTKRFNRTKALVRPMPRRALMDSIKELTRKA